MSSNLRRQASQLKGAKSPGPVTEAGKAIASKNALRHGLLSRDALLPSEDPAEYKTFCEEFYRAFQPVGAAERFCVEQMIDAAWRLRRVPAIEAGMLRMQMFAERVPTVPPEPTLPIPGLPASVASLSVPPAVWRRYRRDSKSYEKAVADRDRALRRVDQRRNRRENDLGRAFAAVEATDGISKLQRYQSKHERLFRRFWKMLRELQAARIHEKRTSQVIDVEPRGAGETEGRIAAPAGVPGRNGFNLSCKTSPPIPMGETECRDDEQSAPAGPREFDEVFCQTNPTRPAEADEDAQLEPPSN
jgi:hypothetical protein